MNINKVKHDKCDLSNDTSLYLQSGRNVLSACYFTYSPKTEQEQNFIKVQAQINKYIIFAP